MKKYSGMIIWGVVIILILCLFFVRVTYETLPYDNPNFLCVNGKLMTKSTGNQMMDVLNSRISDISGATSALGCSIVANGDLSVTIQIECVNGDPTVICKTQLYKAILMGKIKFVSYDSANSVDDRLSEKEIAFMISLNAKYPQGPTIDEVKRMKEIYSHVDSICKTHCGSQFFNQAHLGTSGNEWEIQCYCTDSNFYIIDPRTGVVLIHNTIKD